jgi:uncharacterized SAM-binding protein YcdF (DUF218 family)
MFVFLSKILPLLVYPLGLACVFLVISLLISHKKRLRTGWVIAALVILYVSSNRWVSSELARSLEWRYLLPPNPMPTADVIVVLGGATEPFAAPRPSVEVNSAGDRPLYAARLYHQGVAPYLLLSGGNVYWNGNVPGTPASDMADIVELAGVPQDAIWIQDQSQNTYEDALYSSKMLKEKGIQKIILVTSAMHMPRSVALFQKQGIEVIPAPTDYTITQIGWDELIHGNIENFLLGLFPNTSSLGLTTNALKEYIGIAVYRLQGWL